MAVGAGALRERVRFDRRPAVEDDGFGNTIGPWEPATSSMAARIRPLPGREEVLAQRLGGVQPYEITVRASKALRGLSRAAEPAATEWRAVNVRTLETYDITDIRNPDERGEDLVFLVRKGVADG